jgi:hypothetical protein
MLADDDETADVGRNAGQASVFAPHSRGVLDSPRIRLRTANVEPFNDGSRCQYC